MQIIQKTSFKLYLKHSMKNKIVLFAILFFIFQTISEAQFEEKSIGISVFPTWNGRLLKIKDAASELKDSLNNTDKLKSNISYGIQYRFKTSKNWYMSTGIYYQNMGFKRMVSPVNFKDTIHPNIPYPHSVILDQTDGGGRSIQHNVNYHYLDVPAIFYRDFTPAREYENKISLMMGLSANFMIKHHTYIKYRGFTPGGLEYYDLEDTSLDPLRINFSAIIGARFETILYPKVNIYFQPHFKKHLLFASYGIEQHHLYSLNAEIGFTFSLKKDKEKE
jgi:hypothetical protein